MIYGYVCTDRGDQTETRRRLLVDHLRYIESIADKVLVGGPTPPQSAGDTRQFVGSVLLYNVRTRAEAEALFRNDPYAQAGIWDIQEIAFSPVIGDVVGGITWDIVDGQVRPRRNR